jgi:DNA polymerase III epsilon subunit-like protein
MQLDDVILFYDTETSGFPVKQDWKHPAQPHCIQLGWVLGTKDETFSEGNILIKPTMTKWEMSASAQAVHGISKEEVMRDGMEAKSAVDMFGAIAAKSSLRVCHNTKFDQKIITILFRRAGRSTNEFWTNTFCTMLASVDVCKLEQPGRSNYKWPKLQELHEFLFGCKFADAHDALADVQAMRRCYYEMKQRQLF